MTDADTIKKLKPTATVARSESLKDLSTLKCNVCGADVWSKNGWIGGYCVKKMVHFLRLLQEIREAEAGLSRKGGFCQGY